MKTLKIVLITVLVIGFNNVCWGQQFIYIDTPQVMPSHPSIYDTVKIRVMVSNIDGGGKIYDSISVSGSSINIYYCIASSTTLIATFFNDTFNVGLLTEGTYNIQVWAYKSSHRVQCVSFDTSYFAKTFDVTFANSLSPIELTGHKIKLSPNPTANFQNLTISLEKPAELEITLHDISGRLVKTIHKGKSPEGEATIEADLTSLAKGMYLYCVSIDGERQYLKTLKH